MPDLDPFCFDTQMVFLKYSLKLILEKNSAEDKKHGNFSRGKEMKWFGHKVIYSFSIARGSCIFYRNHKSIE